MVVRSISPLWALLVSALSACGGQAASNLAAASGGSDGTSGSGMGGVAGVPSGSGGAAGTCDPTMNSQASVPSSQGCFAGTDRGWVQVPCLCELWLKNTTESPLAVVLTLYGGSPDPDASGGELDLKDPDATFYSVWSLQAAAGAPISVVRDGNVTAVRPAASSVALSSVVVPACSFFTGQANVGISGALSMHADFLDAAGNVVLTSDGSCFRPPHL